MNSAVTYQGQLKPQFAKISSIFSGSARIIIVLTNTVSDYRQFLLCLTRKNEREDMTMLVKHPPLVGPHVRFPFSFGTEGPNELIWPFRRKVLENYQGGFW